MFFLHYSTNVTGTAYKFELKIVTPRNAVLGQIKDLRLPWLTEMYDFKPPPLSKIIKVSPAGAISFQPSYRLPATCRKDFFVAIGNPNIFSYHQVFSAVVNFCFYCHLVVRMRTNLAKLVMSPPEGAKNTWQD